jgi:hypothetical protein
MLADVAPSEEVWTRKRLGSWVVYYPYDEDSAGGQQHGCVLTISLYGLVGVGCAISPTF